MIPRARRIDKTWKPIVAGYLNIVTFAIIFLVTLMVSINGLGEGNSEMAWAVVFNIPGFCILFGGVAALAREKWGLALAGSIVAMLFGLGILSAILISMSKKEFT